MTDRNDLDGQIYKTFVGCGIAADQTPRAASGDDLEKLLKENHRYVFSLIHKFNKDVDPKQPYSERDDIIVISDEAHRTQAGRLARNMRLALPNAAFIGFTGTPLFRHDEITKRIFGDYVSRYDFKRSEEDGATVKLVYDNRGEKLGVARTDLNDRIAVKIEQAELDPDQEALLDKLLGQDYEVITADERLDKIAADFVEHCATRWESGKSMLVCIDKITCARMLQLIAPRWQAKAASVRALADAKRAEAKAAGDKTSRAALEEEAQQLAAQGAWLDETIVEIIISEAQKEVKGFAKWGFDILARQVCVRFKALLMEPSAFAYAERHDNIEAIYKKLTERRDTADVTELLKELHRIINEAVRTQTPGDDQAEGLTFDLSQIDMEKLRDEFAKKVRHKATALQDIRETVEQKLEEMLARNPSRMDYQQKYEEIVDDYNREKDRVNIEKTFQRLMELMDELDARSRSAPSRKASMRTNWRCSTC